MELDPRGASETLAALDRVEAATTVPRIEAAERRRLLALAAGDGAARDPGWTAHRLDAWYLGLRTRAGGGGVVGEAGRLARGPVADLLEAAAEADASRVWLRGTDRDDVAAARATGWEERRTLLVLGRDLGGILVPPVPAGLHLASVPTTGAGAIAEVLDRAYAGPRRDGLVEDEPDSGPWTAERVDRVTSVALADPSDLLVAVDGDGRIAGIHWTARRGGGVGEVFNLAVDPGCTGRGVAAWLLGAGLAHLRDVGHREVILWVDERNAPALALYARTGFSERGRDVALGR